MLWDDICAKLGMPNNVSFNILPPGTRVLSCYYVEEVINDWGGESVYSLDDTDDTDTVSTETARMDDEDFDY